VVVAVSGKEPLHRCGLVLSKPVKRLAVAGGLVLAGWALGAVLSTTASADELPPGFDGGGAVSTVDVSPRSTTQLSTTNVSTTQPDGSASPKTTAQSDSGQSATDTTKATTKPESTSRQKKSSQPSGGLLGGLLGSLVNTVGSTLNTTVSTVAETVGGLVGTVDQTVITPVTGGGRLSQPSTLPLVGDLVSGGGGWASGGTVTNAVAISTVPTAQAATPASASSRPGTPQPAAPAAASHLSSTMPTHVGPHVAAKPVATDQPPTQSGKRIGAPAGGGGSGGGRDLPPAPGSPAAPTTVTAGHDGSGGARQQNAILGSSATTTQLRLMGTSLDHEADGAGRDAALPTTSPD
jgi:hypothetical protein